MTESERKAIVKFARATDSSFQLVADHFGITRNQVAGIIFRHRHPAAERKKCDPKGNKIGTGYRRGDYAANTVWSARREQRA